MLKTNESYGRNYYKLEHPQRKKIIHLSFRQERSIVDAESEIIKRNIFIVSLDTFQTAP